MVLMVAIGLVNWQVQERLAPTSNQRQDALRTQIRNRGSLAPRSGAYWVANDRRIYSFQMGVNNLDGSDNDKGLSPNCARTCSVQNLTAYEFSQRGENLQALYQVESAVWEGKRIVFTGSARRSLVSENGIVTETITGGYLEEEVNPFAEMRRKPSHLTIAEIRLQGEGSESQVERRNFAVALEKKYLTIFLPFVIALFTAPFALSLSRKGKVLTVGYAVGLWLLFMGLTSTFEQVGLNGYIAPSLAIWGPAFLFSILGIFLLSRVKT